MDFALFVMVTAVVFVRPTDFVPGLENMPLYLMMIVPCILLSWHKIVPQLNVPALRERPVLVFGFGILVQGFISGLARGRPIPTYTFAGDYSKLLILYVLMLAHLDSPRRLKFFAGFLAVIILIPTTLAVLDFNHVITIPGFNHIAEDRDAGDGANSIKRLGATGNFSDPNDMCEIINCAILLSLCGLLNSSGGPRRVLWLGPLALLGCGLFLTKSRGGLLALMVGLFVLFRSRYRGIRSLLLVGALVGLLVLFAGRGRQTTLSTGEGTAQTRIQLWDTGFEMIKAAPLIGHGMGAYQEFVGRASHNAFIFAWADLGFVGGTFLFGQYVYCLSNLAKLGSKRYTVLDPEMRRLQPFFFAIVASFFTSEMSLTNAYCPVTYAMFGTATAFIRVAEVRPPLRDLVLNGRFLAKMLVYTAIFEVALYYFVRFNVNNSYTMG